MIYDILGQALAIRGREEERDEGDDFFEHEIRRELRRRGRRGRKSRRKAIISSLIKILLDPVSPVESEEETEMCVPQNNNFPP